MLRAGAELADPGLLGVLRARPGTQADGTDSGLGQNTVRAGQDHTRVTVSPRGGSSPGSPRGDRSGSGRPSLNSLFPLQEGGESVSREIQKPDQVTEIPLTSPTEFPPLRRGSRIRHKTQLRGGPCADSIVA